MKFFTMGRFVATMLFTTLCISPLLAQDNKSYKRVYLSGKDAANTVDWNFMVTEGRNSGKWTSIPVPSNWELHGFGTYNYGHDHHHNKDRKIAKEQGLYRHRFDVPKNWKNKSINIVFEGAMTDAKVSINGKSAGNIHQGAFYRFKYDITKLLKYGEENLLEVSVAKHSANESVNQAERQGDFWLFGGIFRPVYLEVLPEQNFERIAIDARANGDFTAQVFINKPKAKTSIHVDLLTMDGEKVGETIRTAVEPKAAATTISGRFDNIDAWNPEWPTLYVARVSLFQNGNLLYQKDERIGFRTVELRKKDGFYINGKRVIFKGVNRHSFWPETGRALSKQNHLQDIMLMKEMNMNAVRMSHYPPDEEFLNLCDSLGMFVLDEITGWAQSYDTIVGPKVIKETVLKDENHPSVVIWDHGNEGGWDFANEKWFHAYDIQKRPVIYPWLKGNGVDAYHYPDYHMGVNRSYRGDDVFMPTEFLHGLHDGGHGAGLQDFWSNYSSSPLFAGGFLWVFADEAVVRTDQGGILDAAGNYAPDGIVGPYREKEGSFYTIKEIWAPIQIKPVVVNKDFEGEMFIENTYLYTNLDKCSFTWSLSSVNDFSDEEIIGSGSLQDVNIPPGETRRIKLDIPDNISNADIFTLSAKDFYGREIYTWTWLIKQPEEVAKSIVAKSDASSGVINIAEKGDVLEVKVEEMSFHFNKSNGFLEKIDNGTGVVSLNGGPLPVGTETAVEDVAWEKDKEGNFILKINYNEHPKTIQWTLTKSGLLKLEAAPLLIRKDDIDYIGISFNYPEELVEGVRWLGKGPYRVWKNRMKGTEFGVWQKDYNNTMTGASTERLVYPEFKGYHADMYWLELQTKESSFTILTETPGLFFRLYSPGVPEHATKTVTPPFPEGDLSFLYEIPAIGTKFKEARLLGPSSQKGTVRYHNDDEAKPIILWFDFRD